MDFKYENDILYIILSGDYSQELSKEHFNELLELTKEYKCNKVLIDTTKINNITTSQINAYDYGKHIADEYIGQSKKGVNNIKFAYLHTKENEEVFKLGELVAQNRGVTAMAFLDNYDAVRWLSELE